MLHKIDVSDVTIEFAYYTQSPTTPFSVDYSVTIQHYSQTAPLPSDRLVINNDCLQGGSKGRLA